MPRDEQNQLTPHAVLGVFIALMGVIFTLDNLGLADTAIVSRYWPVVPIAIGVILLMHANRTRDWVFGSAWMAAGALLLARSLGWVSFQLRDYLPLLLVAVGARLIWRDRERAAGTPTPPPAPTDLSLDATIEDQPLPLETPPPIPPAPPSAAPKVEPEPPRPRHRTREHRQSWPWCGTSSFREGWTPWQQFESWRAGQGRPWAPRRGHVRMLALMSGVERRLRSVAFSSAEMTAIMGACELDLRGAEMEGNEAHISAFALWGGLEIRVPEHWIVVNRCMALMGGVEDSSRHVDSPDRPRLFVHGFALMAGIEIRN